MFALLCEKDTNLLSQRWSKGSQNEACWGSERLAEGWGHPGCMGQGTAGIKAHWTGYSPNWFSHQLPDLPSCCCLTSDAPGEETAAFKLHSRPVAKINATMWINMFSVGLHIWFHLSMPPSLSRKVIHHSLKSHSSSRAVTSSLFSCSHKQFN